ncbi:MAG: bifunctional diaminohydroxyphosphoribosylaminopyrimidine deaminase/5-amino-6-(5-phosphoribosylamino)uracil reductase RibD [Acidobacteria bacterium]|nr:bifunctional diaminohydroxyphosphoribosylaminopyrimidine deaminase/5-amino-6-(5-phosphoribosylamino)uracil reductase RibD [Acidobacteriota bacterium]
MPAATENRDRLYMAQALELARSASGLTSPNPSVGAVIVAGERVVGRGVHTYEGVAHAEVHALDEAGPAARGATLYLNLEPCSHQGRTGPCVDHIIAAGIVRVVVAMRDPNPLMEGRSLERLRSAGLDVVVGVEEREAKRLNEAFAKYIRQRRPLVTLKAGMTLDGKIAPPPGDGELGIVGSGAAAGGWITSERARAHVQELRHGSDAIMVGVGTIVADDPLLTDRTGEPRRRRLLRVILDSRLRLPLDSRVVKTAKHDVIVYCSFAEEKKRRELEARGIRVEQLPLGERHDGRPGLSAVIAHLGTQEITSLIIEGGALVNWTALHAGIVDKVFLYYAPKILAGTGSVPFAGGAGFRHMSEAAQVRSITLHRFGGTDDFAVEGYIRDPYEYEVAAGSPAEAGAHVPPGGVEVHEA